MPSLAARMVTSPAGLVAGQSMAISMARLRTLRQHQQRRWVFVNQRHRGAATCMPSLAARMQSSPGPGWCRRDGNFYGTTPTVAPTAAKARFRISATGALTTLYIHWRPGCISPRGLAERRQFLWHDLQRPHRPLWQWDGLQNQRHWGADHFVFIHWRQ